MNTGIAVELGVTGFSKIEALAINAAGEIYGVNPASAQLVKCSSSTGACVAVGVLTGIPQVQTNAGLAFASTGALYLAMNAVVYRVDPATGGTAPLGGTGPALSGLAGVNATATCASGLFGIGGNSDRGKLYCVNTTTGVATQLASLTVNPLDSGLDGDITTGLVWGISNDTPGQVFAVNPVTLTVGNVNSVTLDGKAIGGFESLAISRTGTQAITPDADPAVPVPTLTFWGALSLSLLLSLFAGRRFRAVASRRK